jgi:hypothetical protein
LPQRNNEGEVHVHRLRPNFLLLAVAVLGLQTGLVQASESELNVKSITYQKGDLTVAIMRGDSERVRVLVQAGADVNENIGTANKPLAPMLASIVFHQTEIANFLLTRPVDLRFVRDGYTLADYAFLENESDLGRRLLVQIGLSGEFDR